LGLRRRLDVSDRPKIGWEALTSAELAVARLAAADNTNRQIAEKLFISPPHRQHPPAPHLREAGDQLSRRYHKIGRHRQHETDELNASARIRNRAFE